METNIITVTNFVTLTSTNIHQNIGGLDVVNQVKDFFNTSFTHLLWLLGTLLTILGFAVPAFYFALAKWQLKIGEKKLAANLHKELDVSKAKLNQEIDEKFSQLEKILKSDIHHTKAGVFIVQGHFYTEMHDLDNALKSYISMIDHFARTTDLKRLQGGLDYLANILEDFEGKDISMEAAKSFKNAIERVSKIESYKLLDTNIEKLEKAFAEAQKRGTK